ncbi:Na+/H+ antiporter subunit C [Chelativorans intermedius]|uniref:Na+/H+ antiporter subunit C n=1 Tax=Chelativorans intermedius TaxID=515947 RepID=A0ABV6DD31_9HYPH|nr:Na+/H+ antiporter subunit C [Chelativorans intermedius]MCT8999606.1 Na+/H+ antiporter subunit C [Chelativorans intermedius]
METILAFTVAVFFAVSIYLMLSKHIIRILLGVAIFGNAVNLTLFTAGRVTRVVPPIIPVDLDTPAQATANPLPQALILTAIVISFSIFAFLLVLAFRAYQELGTDDTDGMRVAEPKGEELPPLGY